MKSMSGQITVEERPEETDDDDDRDFGQIDTTEEWPYKTEWRWRCRFRCICRQTDKKKERENEDVEDKKG